MLLVSGRVAYSYWPRPRLTCWLPRIRGTLKERLPRSLLPSSANWFRTNVLQFSILFKTREIYFVTLINFSLRTEKRIKKIKPDIINWVRLFIKEKNCRFPTCHTLCHFKNKGGTGNEVSLRVTRRKSLSLWTGSLFGKRVKKSRGEGRERPGFTDSSNREPVHRLQKSCRLIIEESWKVAFSRRSCSS